MVDTTEAVESRYINALVVSNSPTKRLIVLGEGYYEMTQYGKRLTVPVEIDGKQKYWRPNPESIANLWEYGRDTKAWVGKFVMLRVEKRKEKDCVIGRAYPQDIATAK